MIPSGTYTFGPPDSTLLLHTYKEGMARKIGHDLVIEVTRWDATVTVDADDVTRSSAQLSADTRSMEVRSGSGGAKSLSDDDRRDIEKNINEKVLKTSQHPQITFRSTKVEAAGTDAFTVTGDLTVMGTTKPLRVDITIAGDRAKCAANLVQTQWGIKPFSAMMGALKVRDALDITVEAPLPKG